MLKDKKRGSITWNGYAWHSVVGDTAFSIHVKYIQISSMWNGWTAHEVLLLSGPVIQRGPRKGSLSHDVSIEGVEDAFMRQLQRVIENHHVLHPKFTNKTRQRESFKLHLWVLHLSIAAHTASNQRQKQLNEFFITMHLKNHLSWHMFFKNSLLVAIPSNATPAPLPHLQASDYLGFLDFDWIPTGFGIWQLALPHLVESLILISSISETAT